MNDTDLGRFLRTRREALKPAEVGLSPGRRRRTPGLRRGEVARLAAVSPDYYERLERSHATNPSAEVLDSLAGAMRMSADDRNHLYRLAGHLPPAGGTTGEDVDPALLFLLNSLDTVPAHVMDDLTTMMAQNRGSKALFGSWPTGDERAANVTWRWFTDSASQPSTQRR
jgi:transcriptional regulator with XRE-family HTH domain